MLRIVLALALMPAALLTAAPATAATRGCPDGMPCIQAVYNSRANLIVEWNDTDKRDRYNFRWSRPGKGEVQVERPGGRDGSFTLKNFKPNVMYTFKVQGCRVPLIGRSTCTGWYEEAARSCGARSNPCR